MRMKKKWLPYVCVIFVLVLMFIYVVPYAVISSPDLGTRLIKKKAISHSIPRLFFRNDDVYENDTTLIRFVNLFIEEDVPIALGVMPKAVTPECIAYLLEKQRQYPHLIEIDMHGVIHKVTTPQGHAEFNHRLRFVDVYNEVQNGAVIMRKEFSDAYSEIFTVPYSSYGSKLIDSLILLNFTGFSAHKAKDMTLAFYDPQFYNREGLDDYSTCVDVMTD